jgi:hypothetical protein
MISPQQCDTPWVFQFEAKEQSERFYAVVSAVDKVSQEDVGRGWWPSSSLEEVNEIEKLSMEVSDDRDG